MGALNIVFVIAALPFVRCGRTNVFVKFLSPPSGYSHLQLTGAGGVAVSREERIYPGDPRHATFQPMNQFQTINHRFQSSPFQQNNQFQKNTLPQNNHYQGNTFRQNNQYQGNTFQQNNQYQGKTFQQNNQYQGKTNTFQQSNRFLQDDSFRINQTPKYRYSQQEQTSGYYYPPPPGKPFEEYGPPRHYQGDSNGVPEEPYLPSGEYYNPDPLAHSQAEVTYDPDLISGPSAARYVAFLLNKGELFFDLIPHGRLVLMNQQERVKNNLVPHVLGSIRPGHPFFNR